MTKASCPECGAQFEGDAIVKASEKLTLLAEELAAAKTKLGETASELEQEKNKHVPAVPAPVARKKAKRRMLFGASKRAA